MNTRWREVSLGELCEFRNGLWKGKKPPYVHVGVIRNTNFASDGTLDDSDIAFLDVEERQFAKRQLRYGDLILEKSGGGPKQPVGRVIAFEKTDGLFSFSNFTSIIRVQDSSVLDFRFLHRVLYWYYTDGVTESMQRRSTGIRNLEFGAYKALPIPLPPLPEQKRIVAILDEAFAAIATATTNAEKNLTNAQSLLTCERNDVFRRLRSTSDVIPLGRSCLLENGDRGKNYASRSMYVSSGIPMLSAANLCDGAIDTDSLNFITRDRFDRLGSGKIRPGDILYCLRGSLGKFGSVGELREGAIASSLVIVRPDLDVFVDAYLLEYFFSEQAALMVERFSNGTAQPNLSAKSLSLFEVPAPTREEQHAVAGRLVDIRERIQSLASCYECKLDRLTELKQSLLHKAFTGELTAADRSLAEVI